MLEFHTDPLIVVCMVGAIPADSSCHPFGSESLFANMSFLRICRVFRLIRVVRPGAQLLWREIKGEEMEGVGIKKLENCFQYLDDGHPFHLSTD